MSRWPDSEEKTEMRLNILRHRQKLLKLLEDVDDTVLKPKIKLDTSDLETLNSVSPPKFDIQQEIQKDIKQDVKEEIIHNYKIKQELLDDDEDEIQFSDMNSDSENELISVGSNEEWNGSYQTSTSDEAEVDQYRRRSRRLETIDGNRPLLCNVNKKNDYVYYLDNSINDDGELQKKKRKRSWKRPDIVPDGNISKKRFKAPIDRDLHNAKERACRDHIAKMFLILQKYCSYLDSKRRTPSKMSILLAAKTEICVLKDEEKKLAIEKNNWREANRDLKRKLKEMIASGTKENVSMD